MCQLLPVVGVRVVVAVYIVSVEPIRCLTGRVAYAPPSATGIPGSQLVNGAADTYNFSNTL
jgi:hypothetical protein